MVLEGWKQISFQTPNTEGPGGPPQGSDQEGVVEGFLSSGERSNGEIFRWGVEQIRFEGGKIEGCWRVPTLLLIALKIALLQDGKKWPQVYYKEP